jgi:vesicle coat complex subunit
MMMFLPYTFDNTRLQSLRTPQGKVAELRIELNNGNKKDKNFSAKKTALKKIVANMTMSNNDMVALFMDIVGCMHIPSLEIKKMCVVTSIRARASLTWAGVSCISSTMPG